ncbi:MAG: PspA/IM30 family protein [Candidatus Eremiobacteraeota bacterium]|nr:PspA/IM30 family protein [Candidatus Eremiobacteraeota bacterium]
MNRNNLFARLFSFLNVRGHATLDRLEDPNETLEVAYQREVEALQEVRRGVTDVLTAEKRLELETNALRSAAARHRTVAEAAVRAGDDEKARLALGREAFVEMQTERLGEQIADVRLQRVALESNAEKLRMRVELFRTEKLAMGARYAASKATAKASETLGGLSSNAQDVARMVDRAREKTLATQARAEALTELADRESLPEGVERPDAGRIEAQLAALKASAQTALPPS